MEENMRSKLILLSSVIMLALSLVACASAPSIELSCDDFSATRDISKEITVAPGDTFSVILCSNATTGFKWSVTPDISDTDVMMQLSHKFEPPENTGMVGAAGKETWTFKALKTGTATTQMGYSQPWGDDEQDGWVFRLSVVVK
jgi:inhibitor of cysteine peptidase